MKTSLAFLALYIVGASGAAIASAHGASPALCVLFAFVSGLCAGLEGVYLLFQWRLRP